MFHPTVQACRSHHILCFLDYLTKITTCRTRFYKVNRLNMKQNFHKSIHPFILILLLFMIYSCKGPEATTILVQQKSVDSAPPGSYEARDTSAVTAIHILQYGEVNPISSLDPLFANNSATRRIDMLIYEGLTKYDKNGNIIPGLAKSWDVARDSLTYTFHLNTSIYYQDQDAFTSGVGRRISASDVKFTFDRMALDSVPTAAADLFMDINGFDTYYKEQHEVLNTKEKTLNNVPGITVPNDSTVIFKLDFTDPDFIRKLASPLAVIYPPEAVNNANIATNPVGTGPFQLLKDQSDTLFVLVKNSKYHRQKNNLDRIEIRIYPNEQSLFKGLASNEIDYIPELGPAQLHALLNSDGQLLPGYNSRFNLINSGGYTTFGLFYNAGNFYKTSRAQTLSMLFHFPLENYINWIGKTNISLPYNDITSKNLKKSSLFTNPDAKQSITVQYQPFEPEHNFILSLSDSLSHTYKVTLVKAPVVSRSIVLYAKALPKLYDDGHKQVADNEIYRINIMHKAITDKSVTGIQLNKFTWWQDLTSVSVPPTSLQ